jgi:hypothetical protein
MGKKNGKEKKPHKRKKGKKKSIVKCEPPIIFILFLLLSKIFNQETVPNCTLFIDT